MIHYEYIKNLKIWYSNGFGNKKLNIIGIHLENQYKRMTTCVS